MTSKTIFFWFLVSQYAWHERATAGSVILSRLAFHNSETSPPSTLSHSIRLIPGSRIQLYIRGYPVDMEKCAALDDDFWNMDDKSSSTIKSIIDVLDICIGNPDVSLVRLFQHRRRLLVKSVGARAALLDSHSSIRVEDRISFNNSSYRLPTSDSQRRYPVQLLQGQPKVTTGGSTSISEKRSYKIRQKLSFVDASVES